MTLVTASVKDVQGSTPLSQFEFMDFFACHRNTHSEANLESVMVVIRNILGDHMPE